MKKIDEFEHEETCEEWLREGYKVVSMRRNIMFRMLLESTRLLLFGNAGGTALIIGFMSAAGTGGDEGLFHWLALATMMIFGVGILTSALTVFLVTIVSVGEAHGSETALKRFTDGEGDRSDVMFNVERRTWRTADWATLTGIVSAACFIMGGLGGIVLLVVFF